MDISSPLLWLDIYTICIVAIYYTWVRKLSQAHEEAASPHAAH